MKRSVLILISVNIVFIQHSISVHASVKPNIVLIIIDDLGWKDVGYMGSTYYETPHIDRLAKAGMVFTNAYANAANCAPTRACLLSGQYTPRHGVYTVARPDRGKSEDRRLVPPANSRKISPDKITIAEALKPAGYASAAIGKWHVADPPPQQGFELGINKFEIANGYERGHFNKDNEYLTDRLTNEAVAFIDKNKDRPFFLYLAHYAVHTPIEAKEDITARYETKEADGCHRNAVYAAMIESVDESVRDIYNTLEDLGLIDNTLVIFFSDNGGHGTYTCQKPLRGGKGMFYEGGIRVPMFVHWPGMVEGGTVCDFPVIGTDFYPTFLELAGVPPPRNYPLDGESIVRLFKGKKSVKRDALFWHFPAYLEAYAGLQDESRDPVFRTRPVSVIRKGDWKLLMFHEEWVLDGGQDKISSNNSVELYNLKKDPGESKNLVNEKNRKLDKLLVDLLEWQEKITAPIPRQANAEYIEK